MDKLKLYTHEEMLDAVVGVKGTPRRDKYEADINNFLIGEAIKKEKPKISHKNSLENLWE